MENVATDWDHRIIDGVSIALSGKIGSDDDVARLRKQIEEGESTDKLETACKISVAFIRWAQDLKERARVTEAELEKLKASKRCGGPAGHVR